MLVRQCVRQPERAPIEHAQAVPRAGFKRRQTQRVATVNLSVFRRHPSATRSGSSGALSTHTTIREAAGGMAHEHGARPGFCARANRDCLGASR